MTSALTLGEVLVKPTKDSRNDLISEYETLFADIECVPIGQDVARLSSSRLAIFSLDGFLSQ
jgi:hypothetical protein